MLRELVAQTMFKLYTRVHTMGVSWRDRPLYAHVQVVWIQMRWLNKCSNNNKWWSRWDGSIYAEIITNGDTDETSQETSQYNTHVQIMRGPDGVAHYLRMYNRWWMVNPWVWLATDGRRAPRTRTDEVPRGQGRDSNQTHNLTRTKPISAWVGVR